MAIRRGSRLGPLITAERRVKAADGDGITRRIQAGAALLANPHLVTAAGHLRHGAAEIIARALAAAGQQEVPAWELRDRLQAARTYQTGPQIAWAATRFGSWTALREARFPAAPADAQPALVTEDGTAVDPDAVPVQPPLDGFPAVLAVGGALVPLAAVPLSAVAAWCRSSERWTAGHARADDRRRAELDRLTAAAGGDLSMTVGQARALADAGAA